MEALLGFSLDFWDYATFLSLSFLVAVGLGFVVFMLGLPGRIAIARNHPEAETIETLRADWRSLAMTRMLQLLSIILGLSL